MNWELDYFEDLSGPPWLRVELGGFDLVVEYCGPGYLYKAFVLSDSPDLDFSVEGLISIEEAKEVAESMFYQYLMDLVGL